MYVPGSADGTLKLVAVLPNIIGYDVATFVLSKLIVTSSFESNPATITYTVVPTGPLVGLNVKVSPLAFAAGVITADKVNMLKTSSPSVTLVNPSFKHIKRFSNGNLSRHVKWYYCRFNTFVEKHSGEHVRGRFGTNGRKKKRVDARVSFLLKTMVVLSVFCLKVYIA